MQYQNRQNWKALFKHRSTPLDLVLAFGISEDTPGNRHGHLNDMQSGIMADTHGQGIDTGFPRT